MIPALIAIATEIGAPIVKGILARKIGAANAELAGDVVAAIASRAGVAPEELGKLAKEEPARVQEAVRATEENDVRYLLPIYQAEAEARRELMQAEQGEPLWARLWRPLGMYFLFVLWAWNLILLHVANAIWKIALPPTDLSILLQLTTLYLSLYMGGHTVKAVVESWSRK